MTDSIMPETVKYADLDVADILEMFDLRTEYAEAYTETVMSYERKAMDLVNDYEY